MKISKPNPGLCRQHDQPVDRTGRCPTCYLLDDEYAEAERDVLHLWRTR